MSREQRWDGWSGDDDDVDTGTFGRSSLHGCIQFVSKEGCCVGRSYDRVLLGGAEGSTSEVR
ncbi:unnamed protein product [Brugia timori]|uniref:Uncharacterized protein n=1 Tax=Brugia timori TaxID=42155 RepID=A0A3P7YMR2_9BILA|nr:unnamed protein product [Brugia timori]